MSPDEKKLAMQIMVEAYLGEPRMQLTNKLGETGLYACPFEEDQVLTYTRGSDVVRAKIRGRMVALDAVKFVALLEGLPEEEVERRIEAHLKHKESGE